MHTLTEVNFLIRFFFSYCAGQFDGQWLFIGIQVYYIVDMQKLYIFIFYIKLFFVFSRNKQLSESLLSYKKYCNRIIRQYLKIVVTFELDFSSRSGGVREKQR